MEIFLELITNLIPLYLLIGAGFLIGRRVGIDTYTLANLILYLCMPIMVFGFIAQLDFKPAYVLLPVYVFLAQLVIGLGMLQLGRKIYGDSRANLLSMCASMGNSGYFGIPLVLLLLPDWAGVYIFMMLGFTLYEGTIGYYIAARGKFTVRDSIIKVLKFPSVYAITAGLLVNYFHIELPELFLTYWTYFKGAYVILGMMIIGAALANMERLVFSIRFISLSFLGKFIFWPLLALGFILLDRLALHMFEEPVQVLILIAALVPPAANIAAFAAQFDMRPEKAATTILAGTVIAIFYIPLVLTLTGMR